MQLDARYAAGLFDGEGSITIYRTPIKWAHPSHYLQVNLGMQCKEAVEALLATWGGHIYQDKTIWQWRITGEIAKLFLLDIFPYSIVKKSQIEIALEFQDKRGSFLNWRKGQSGYKGISDEIVKMRESYRERLKASRYYPQRLNEPTPEKVMQQSELYGNIESVAEMATPIGKL